MLVFNSAKLGPLSKFRHVNTDIKLNHTNFDRVYADFKHIHTGPQCVLSSSRYIFTSSGHLGTDFTSAIPDLGP